MVASKSEMRDGPQPVTFVTCYSLKFEEIRQIVHIYSSALRGILYLRDVLSSGVQFLAMKAPTIRQHPISQFLCIKRYVT